MRFVLALASLRRARSRTLLAVAGVAIAAAMLLDMVMLATGLHASFGELLRSRGFEIRLAPRGTLPFDTEATITGAKAIIRTLGGHPAIDGVSPVLGASVHVVGGDQPVTAFALGVDPARQGDYEIVSGSDANTSSSLVANDDFLRQASARVGDTLRLATGYNPQLRSYAGERRFIVAGRARFVYLSAGQPAVAMPLATLQVMTGQTQDDRVSLLMVSVADGANAERVSEWIEREIPRVDAISTSEALERVDERLSYFRQISFILGGVSLVVGFLLVTTLITVSVNDRLGEIAVMRAIGVSRSHIVHQILLESTAITIAGATAGLALGLVTGRYLNAILAGFPGLPAAIDFFVFQPRAVWTAFGLLLVSGMAAGVYPSWRAASLPIARTLREEAVA